MEFQDVIRRRRMMRHYDMDRPVPPDVVDRILCNGLRAPSAGFSRGWAFLIPATCAAGAGPRQMCCTVASGDSLSAWAEPGPAGPVTPRPPKSGR